MKRTLVLLTFLIALGLIAAPAFGQETFQLYVRGALSAVRRGSLCHPKRVIMTVSEAAFWS